MRVGRNVVHNNALTHTTRPQVSSVESYLNAGLAAGEKAEAEANKVATQKAVFIFARRRCGVA